MQQTQVERSKRRYVRLRPAGAARPDWKGALPALLGLLALFLFGAFVLAPEAQDDTADATRAALARAGYDGVAVTANGQNVQVVGSTTSPDEAEVVAAVARGATCDTWVASDLVCPTSVAVALTEAMSATTVAEGTLPPTQAAALPDAAPELHHTLRIARDSGGVRLTGEVPDQASRTEIVTLAKARYTAVQDELQVLGGTSNGDLKWAALRALDTLSPASSGLADWRAGKLTVVAEAPQQAHDSIGERFGDASTEGRLGTLELRATDQDAQCDARFQALLGETQVRFRTGRADIAASAQPLLKRLAALVKACPMALDVEGHTDAIGDANDNLVLSHNRAEAVVKALAALGVDPDRLTPRGFGAARPIADNATRAGRASNRRIEIHVSPLTATASSATAERNGTKE